MRRRQRVRGDEGTALLEFTLLGLLLLVPLVYVVLAASQVQRAAYAATDAAREAGRGFVTAPDGGSAGARAQAAAAVALANQGMADVGATVDLACSGDPCLTPGAVVTVTVRVPVALPFVPAVLGRPAAVVPVTASHRAVVDAYLPARP